MLTLSAEKPYVHIVLTPTLINFIAPIVPNRMVEPNRSFFSEQSPLIKFMNFDRALPLATSGKYHGASYLLFACLLLWLFALRRLTILLFPHQVGPEPSVYFRAVGESNFWLNH